MIEYNDLISGTIGFLNIFLGIIGVFDYIDDTDSRPFVLSPHLRPSPIIGTEEKGDFDSQGNRRNGVWPDLMILRNWLWWASLGGLRDTS